MSTQTVAVSAGRPPSRALASESALHQHLPSPADLSQAGHTRHELWEGAEGLCHISKLALERVEKPEDVVSLNDEIIVKCIAVNEKGQIDLSRKDALKDAQRRNENKKQAE